MKTNAKLMSSLKAALTVISPLAEAGDENAHVQMAFCEALYEYLAEGNCLTDLDWFKGTSYYTGESAESLPKAA